MLMRSSSRSTQELHHQPLLSLNNVSVNYHRFQAIQDVSIEVRRGEVLAVVGEHRAGKSTVAKAMAGVIKPTTGHVFFNGHDRKTTKPVVEMVHQGVQTIPELSVLENIFLLSPTALTRKRMARMVQTARAALAELGEDISLDRPAGEFGADQQIYIDFVRAVCNKPDLLIIDELDQKLSPEKLEAIYNVLFRLRRQGVAIVYVSNNFEQLFSFADRVCVMRDGKVVGVEEVQDLDTIKLINLTYSFVLTRDELTQENRELYFEKKYHQTVIENLSDGVIVLDDGGRLHSMNQSASRWFYGNFTGYIGTHFSHWFDRLQFVEDAEIRDAIERNQKATWKNVERGEDVFQVEVIPFTDELHQPLGLIVTLANVTDQRAVEDYLIRTEKIASVAQLAAGIAHEVNNPLGIVSNYLQLLSDETRDSSAQHYVKKIQQQLQRITDVMGSMLNFSKVNPSNTEAVNVLTMVNDVLALLNHQLSDQHIKLVLNLPEENQPILVAGNKTLLSQVVVNLINNAIDAIDGRGQLEIQVEHPHDQALVDITVADSGPGIPNDLKDRLFTPFFSTKQTKKNAGLGLAICQHIVDAHHGLIFMNRDHMTRFSVRLPTLASVHEWEN